MKDPSELKRADGHKANKMVLLKYRPSQAWRCSQGLAWGLDGEARVGEGRAGCTVKVVSSCNSSLAHLKDGQASFWG